MRSLLLIFILIAFSTPALADNVAAEGQIFMAEAANGDKEPESGSLVIPGQEEKDESEKKCLNVCKQWGEDCIINPRTGTRNCRRTCKDFGIECF